MGIEARVLDCSSSSTNPVRSSTPWCAPTAVHTALLYTAWLTTRTISTARCWPACPPQRNRSLAEQHLAAPRGRSGGHLLLRSARGVPHTYLILCIEKKYISNLTKLKILFVIKCQMPIKTTPKNFSPFYQKPAEKGDGV